MKKKIIITSIIFIIIIVPVIIMNINKKEENNIYTIETYIDGKLAASLPSSGSGYEFESITCDNGGTAIFNYSTWRVEVTNLNEKTKCTVKFKSSNQPTFANYLTNNAKTLGLVEENGLRYEGADIDVHNYVLFNDELWRIIGVFNVETETNGSQNLVKLIRADALYGLVWDRDNINTWEGSSLQFSLNNGYLNKVNETCNVYSTSVTKTCNFSETGLNTGAREKIEAVKWNVGKLTSIYMTTEEVYTSEISSKTKKYYKVGLMSLSDYGFAYLGDCGRTGYLTTCSSPKSWLAGNGRTWTLTSLSSSKSGSVRVVNGDGEVLSQSSEEGSGVRMSIYLKATVLYILGDGSYDNPFIIS